MIRLISYEAGHMLRLNVQETQAEILGEITRQYAASLETAGPAFTAMLGDEVLGCGGKVKQWEGRWVLWAILSKAAGEHMVAITHVARRFILLHEGMGRLEAIVRSDFAQARRWAVALGLTWHHHEERFLPGNRDADIYVRFC